MTIAFSVESDEELERLESRHLCPEKVLAQLLAQHRAAEEHATRN
jgi:hypothetical protein